MSLYRKNPRRDGSESGIVRALTALGCSVQPLSGHGVPDLLVGIRGVNLLLECKAPLGTSEVACPVGASTKHSGRGRVPGRGGVHLARTTDDAVAAVLGVLGVQGRLTPGRQRLGRGVAGRRWRVVRGKTMNQRMRFLQKRIAAVEAEKHGAVVLVHELAKTWWGRWRAAPGAEQDRGGSEPRGRAAMGKFKEIVLKPRPCCYCGRPSMKLKAYCRPCWNRVCYCGVVDLPSYPTQEDARRLRASVDVEPWGATSSATPARPPVVGNRRVPMLREVVDA